MERLSGIERKYKNNKFSAWDIFDSRVAEKLIGMGKYMYYIDKKPHWKNGKPCKVWCFEYTSEIKEDIKKIKEELKKNESK